MASEVGLLALGFAARGAGEGEEDLAMGRNQRKRPDLEEEEEEDEVVLVVGWAWGLEWSGDMVGRSGPLPVRACMRAFHDL